MFHSTFRRISEATYRIHSLKGVCGLSFIWGQGLKPSGEKNGFRAFHRAKMSTQVNIVGCIFFQKPKQIKYLKTLYLRRVARAFIFAVQVGTARIVLTRSIRHKAHVIATSYSFPEI